MPSRISHITVFISVTLIIVLIMVIAHITRLIVGMRSKMHSKVYPFEHCAANLPRSKEDLA
ncbi:hypothetical protein TELCIR_08984 [Teladorsagia circumcincta]|uniref:Uncharacterized protein n=1 Tax=Teladorsagia circumcincta TaxID=45464 RepID=A0A2G9UG42_TELCI|nr:hypothetical protein TELCIR_08984 [Teladorsagia circumcincta]